MEVWLTFLRAAVEALAAALTTYTPIEPMLAFNISLIVICGGAYFGLPALVIWWVAHPISPRALLKDIGAYRRGISKAERLLADCVRPTATVLEQALTRTRGGYHKFAYSVPYPEGNSVRFFFQDHATTAHVDVPCAILTLSGSKQDAAIMDLLRAPAPAQRALPTLFRKAAA